MNGSRYIKLKLDVVFKAMFGKKENEDLLISFLSSMLEIPKTSIKQIIMDNVELIPDNYADKFSRVDLKMRIDEKLVNVEMQLRDEKNMAERSMFYWSKIFSSELKKNENYKDLPETICINIINFNLFDCPEFHSHFKIMEKNRHEVLSDKFAIHFFELKKLGKKPNKDNPMELWLQLVNAETEEEIDMINNTNVQDIQKAIVVLRDLSADEKMRYVAEMREKAMLDESNALSSAKAEGRAEGRVEGRAEGRVEGRAEGRAEGISAVAENLRKLGISEDIIKKATEE